MVAKSQPLSLSKQNSRYSPEGTDVTNENTVLVRVAGVPAKIGMTIKFLTLCVADLENFDWYVHLLGYAISILD